MDADHDCEAADGVSQVYPGPYLSFYNTPYTNQIKNSHAFVDEIIQEDGPFDAIMGFSQVSKNPGPHTEISNILSLAACREQLWQHLIF